MRAALWAAVVVAALTAVPAQIEAQGFEPLPALSGQSTLSQESLENRDTAVVVWALWSPRCRDIPQRVSEMNARWGDGLRIVTVHFQEDAAKIRNFLGDRRANVPTFLDSDGAFARRYDVTDLPGLLVFRGGRLVYSGRLPADPSSVLRR